MKVTQVEYNFLVNGTWEAESDYQLHEGVPQKGDVINYQGSVYEVVDLEKAGELYIAYLD